MKSIKVVPCRFSDLSSQKLSEVVNCYREVFADGPWHEWKTCKSCGSQFGKKDEDVLDKKKNICCGDPVQDFWPVEIVVSTLLSLPSGASCFIAMESQAIIGFCWGYEMSEDELEKYLNIPVSKSIRSVFGIGRKIAYQSEMGILRDYRGQGIANLLFTERQKSFLSKGVEVTIVRTRKSPEPSITHLWFTNKLGYKTLIEYPDGDGRAILGNILI